MAFRYLAADQHPDHDTIASFRQQHLESLARLFVQALQLCQKAGLVRLGHVAIDGTKLQANASRHKSMSHGKLNEQEQYWKEQVDEMLRRAGEVDTEEGRGPQQCDELPAELARAQSRLKRLEQAKHELEQEAAAAVGSGTTGVVQPWETWAAAQGRRAAPGRWKFGRNSYLADERR